MIVAIVFLATIAGYRHYRSTRHAQLVNQIQAAYTAFREAGEHHGLTEAYALIPPHHRHRRDYEYFTNSILAMIAHHPEWQWHDFTILREHGDTLWVSPFFNNDNDYGRYFVEMEHSDGYLSFTGHWGASLH